VVVSGITVEVPGIFVVLLGIIVLVSEIPVVF